MFYRFLRAVIAFALGLFYKLRVQGLGADVSGPVIFVGNHPNSIIDPALIFVITDRKVTFLAKAPLFKTPVFAQILKGIDALPVFRKADDPGQMNKNEGTFEAASGALIQGRAITLFPEGKSHSEPQLAEIKTGCARIALRAAAAGAPVRIIPVGLTYAEKRRFKSHVLIDVGPPIAVQPFLPGSPAAEADSVRALTEAIAEGLKKVTLNLEEWEDLPLIKTAEELYAFKIGERANDPARLRRFAKGLQIFRTEQPERFEKLRDEVMSFRRRLELINANAKTLTLQYRRGEVYQFILRNAAAVFFGFPLFAIGCALFGIPFLLARVVSRTVKVLPDRVATLKFITALVLAPLWWALLTVIAWWSIGTLAGVLTLIFAVPFAVYTRYFLERRKAAIRDVLTFFVLGSRTKLKARLLVEGDKVAAEIEKVAAEYKSRVSEPEEDLEAQAG